MKNDIKAVLFDFDGVIIDTESNYDVFWQQMSKKYDITVENFSSIIKGNTMNAIIERYFSHFTPQQEQELRDCCSAFELSMEYNTIPGAIKFIEELKDKGVKTALVTSSDDKKVAVAFERLSLDGLFDTIVTADKITQGKPHPMCFLLAAKELEVDASQCVVFEDSFAGIESGLAASMRVIALSTTNSESDLNKYTKEIIPDFLGFTCDSL